LRRALLAAGAGLVLAATTSGAAHAAFPFGQQDASNPRHYKLPGGANQAPNDVGGKELKFAATPEPGNLPTNLDPHELNGVRGPSTVDNADIDQAWRTTTGRSDVTIATLDSGIEWNNAGAMNDLRKKTRINRGEAPEPQTGRTTPLEDGVDCNTFTGSGYDKNGDGVFNVVDYACDPRVERSKATRDAQGKPKGQGPDNMLDPQDVLIAFTDGDDDDGNGFQDDMVGWDFLDDDNDPYDDVQYGHGTGEAEDGFGEANNGGAVSHCPNCMGIHMRVGDSFIADVNNFAEATLYAADNDVEVVQEALGTLNHSKLGLDAVEYAYDHGVTIIASAADEAAQHHNWPSSYPHVVMVNSVTDPADGTIPRSFLQFNGCTNFMANVTLAIPSTSCSSDAVGQSSGMAGLIYSAALNAHERANNPLPNHPTCKRTNGDPCVISANEVRQIMASGTLDPPGDEPKRLQADDVDFLSTPAPGGDDGPGCNPAAPGCTDPNDPADRTLITANRPLFQAIPPNTISYPARKGHDQFYGYGRVNTNKAVDALDARKIPPEVEIRSPVYWWDQVDPARPSFDVRGQVSIREGDFKCEVFVAPGSYPDNDTGAQGDFKKVEDASAPCNGANRGSPLDGRLATVSMAQLKALFPPDAQGFNGREPGNPPREQTSNGRPNTEPYGFTIKVVATGTVQDTPVTGEDRRNEYLHRDQDMLGGFPKKLTADGGASPLFVDLDGDNRNELVLATSDGEVHAYRRDGSELPGWPVRSDPLPIPTGGHGFSARGAILASPAAADIDGDGAPEVVAADLEGKLYVWNAAGDRVLEREAKPEFSGKPLTPFGEVRRGKKYRTQHGFLSSPVLADLDRDDGGRLEIVQAGMDRHVYAWNHDGSAVDGYPVLVVDYSKLGPNRADDTTHAPNFKADVGNLNQGAIINTPAVGDIAGDARPEIVVGTNEEYEPGQGGEPPVDFNQTSSYNAAATLLSPANSRLYALKPEGDPDGPNQGNAPYVAGWPTPIAFLLAEILPVVGEGITGSPAIGPVDCPLGGGGAKVAALAAAGPAYVLNNDGSSCYGSESGRKRPLDTEKSVSDKVTDKPSIPAFGQPIVGEMGEGTGPSVFVPSAGLIRAVDAAANEYQQGGQDQLSGFNAQSGLFRPNYPVQMNDLQFLSGPALSDIDNLPGQEVVSASASLDLQAYNFLGERVNTKWPKLTSDWVVSTPAIDTFGELATNQATKKAIVTVTRSGLIHGYQTDGSPCSAASWPKFHHDNANSGDNRRDAMAPGTPMDVALDGGKLKWKAPGDDLLCGKAESYEVVASDGDTITTRSFRAEQQVANPPAPGDPGTGQEMALPAGTRCASIRAVDNGKNKGRAAVVCVGTAGGLLGPGGGAIPGGPSAGSGTKGKGKGRACLSRRARITRARLGRIKIGTRRSRLLRRVGAPSVRRKRTWRYCVKGGGRVLVAFSPKGRVRLVATTARRHGHGKLRRGSGKKTYRKVKMRRIGRGLYTGRRRSGRVVFRIKRGKVTFVALADRKLARRPRDLRIYVRMVGL
jgi:FG-GAP-like repeat